MDNATQALMDLPETSVEDTTTEHVVMTTTKAVVVKGNIFQPAGVMLAMYLVCGILGILGNALVVLVIFSFTKLRKKLTNVFLIHQSVIDFLASLVLVLLTATLKQFHVPGLAGEVLCRVWLSTYVLWVLFSTSTYNLCLLSLEKYFAIVHPILHKRAFTMSKAVVGMVGVWTLGLVTNTYNFPTSGLRGDICFRLAFWNSELERRAAGITNVFLKYFLPIGVMVYSYGRILVIINRKIAPTETSGDVTSTHGVKYTSAKRKTIRMLIVVCLCFILCWSWNQFFFLALNLGAKLSLGSPFYQFTVVAIFVNSCINPFVYIAKYSEFRQGMKMMFRKCCVRMHVLREDSLSEDQGFSTSSHVQTIS